MTDGKLQDAFRKLREAWFDAHLRSHAHEREWETVDAGERREEQNKADKAEYDEQTEAIIGGESFAIDPRCLHDMGDE